MGSILWGILYFICCLLVICNHLLLGAKVFFGAVFVLLYLLGMTRLYFVEDSAETARTVAIQPDFQRIKIVQNVDAKLRLKKLIKLSK